MVFFSFKKDDFFLVFFSSHFLFGSLQCYAFIVVSDAKLGFASLYICFEG